MINKISQNTAEILSVQPKERSGSLSRVQEQSAVKASNVAQLVQPARDKPTSSTEPVVMNEKEIEEVVESLSEFAQSVQRQLNFSVDESSGKTVIKVIDTETGETIRSIPHEEVLNMQKNLKELSERFFGSEESGVSLLFQGKA